MVATSLETMSGSEKKIEGSHAPFVKVSLLLTQPCLTSRSLESVGKHMLIWQAVHVSIQRNPGLTVLLQRVVVPLRLTESHIKVSVAKPSPDQSFLTLSPVPFWTLKASTQLSRSVVGRREVLMI